MFARRSGSRPEAAIQQAIDAASATAEQCGYEPKPIGFSGTASTRDPLTDRGRDCIFFDSYSTATGYARRAAAQDQKRQPRAEPVVMPIFVRKGVELKRLTTAVPDIEGGWHVEHDATARAQADIVEDNYPCAMVRAFELHRLMLGPGIPIEPKSGRR